MIIVEDIYKRYRTDHGPSKWVLQGVSFTIPAGLNVGLVGQNGAGKSTLLRLIGGIDTPNRGRIERQCRVSWPMGFGGGLQGTLTGRQNAKFVCRVLGHNEDIADRIKYIQEFSELGDAFDEPVKTYSSGMKSRLQFGLSLAFDFDVYISDEVTSTGDAAFRDKAASAFKQLTGRSSLIMVSHGEGTLRQFCTAGIWLDEGHAHWFDDINDALEAYKEKRQESISVESSSNLTTDAAIKAAQEREAIRLEIQAAMEILKKGRNGDTVTVSHEEGRKISVTARKAGIILTPLGRIKKLGYILKQGESPLLRIYLPKDSDKFTEFYDVHSQCIKSENSE